MAPPAVDVSRMTAAERTTDPRRSGVAEPFASDPAFWTSMTASVDAFLATVVAAAAAVALRLSAAGAWILVPFLVAAALIARAGMLNARSSRASRGRFDDPRTWRDAERQAVAAAFVPVLRHRLTGRATGRAAAGAATDR